MSDQQLQQKKPRKILGNGSSTEYTSTVNSLSGYFWNPTAQQTALVNTNCQNNNNIILTESINSIPSNNLVIHQQMERFRISNLMNQEMHTLWPYGTATFLSPMIPTHNMPLPYALAGALPYATVPIYQSLPSTNAQCNVSPASSSSSCSSAATSNQQQQPIQHYLLRANSNTNNACLNELNSSLRNSPVLLSPDESSAIIVNGAGGDATNSPTSSSNNGTVTLSQAKFNELTRLALRGSEIAEKLAYTHRNRPCFKKIDSLCARMKQDLIRPDGVLPNINSQGIAWAVKDFIFVFTRVINAWIIIKGYVYNTPEGLNKVKSALSPDFQASFAAWQDTTMDFIENLIKSFVNLDYLVQSQRNVYQKSDNTTATVTANRNNNVPTATTVKILQHGNPLLEESFDFLNTSVEKCAQHLLDKNYIYTMVEDSEGSQRQATVNGTYFKTGTYTPIKKDPILPEEIPAAAASNNPFAPASNTTLEQYTDERLNEFWTPAVDIELPTNDDNIVPGSEIFLKCKENIAQNSMNYGLRVLEHHLSEFSKDYDESGPRRPFSKDFIEKLNIMIERLNTMKTADFFFKMQFTENYFPDFVAKHKDDFIDVRSIIFKCQIGGYQNIYEVVHDVRKIIYAGKEFLKVSEF